MLRRWNLLVVCLSVGLLGAAGTAWSADNLVFVPLAPCRVIDTRVSGAGGALVAGTPRSFFFRGPTRDYATSPNQGGNAAGCGIPDLTSDGGNEENIAKSVAINIVAVGPAGAGDLRAWPSNQMAPNASVINYAAVAGLNIANGVIVPMCDEVAVVPCTGGDITFRADVSGTNLVVDVVGYFHAGSTEYTVRNTALGHQALAANTTGAGNIAIGGGALAANASGSYNNGVGYLALTSNTTGFDNTAVGGHALTRNTTGHNNTAIGGEAMLYNTAGYDNVALGNFALYSNTIGNRNTGVGFGALGANSGGIQNTAVGYQALAHATVVDNTALGVSALAADITGRSNTALGISALAADVDGSFNTAVGGSALRSNTSGGTNIAVGYYAGKDLTTGFFNIDIGNYGVAGETHTMRIGAAGHQSRAFIAGIRGTTTDNNDAINVVIDSAGQLGTVSSSIRFKEDVHDLGAVADRVLSLRPVSFRYKHPFANGEKPVQYGLIAEEVEKVFPELVAYGRDGKPETVKYQVLPTLLLGELEQEHAVREKDHAELVQAAAELAAVRAQLAAALKRLDALEARPGAAAAPRR